MILWWGRKKQPDPKTGETPIEPLKPGETPASALDKPVASLDPQSAENVLGTLRTIAREEGIAVLCALHQVDLARRFADRVVALRGGRRLMEASAAAFDESAFRALYGVADRLETTS